MKKYFCDGCTKEKPKSELQILQFTCAGNNITNSVLEEICLECSNELISSLIVEIDKFVKEKSKKV